MGKSKKRSLHLGINNLFENITRDEAITHILNAFSNHSIDGNTKKLISLFGFSCEELLESGASYEDVMSLKPLIK